MDASLVAPVLGQLTSFFLCYSASPGLLQDRRRGALTTDPLPFPFGLLTNLLWMLYGTLLQDPWIVLPNFVGLAATTFNTLTVLKLCRDEKTFRTLEAVVGSGIVFVGAMVAVTTTPMFLKDEAVRQSICGSACVAIILVMYGSPTFAAVKALRSGDASAVSLPMALAQLANGLLWGVYGMALSDYVVMGPNSIGALLAFLNITAKLRSFCSLHSVSNPAVEAKGMALLHGDAEIRVRSLHYRRYVRVGDEAADGAAVEQGAAGSSELCVAGDEGTVLRVVPLTGTEGQESQERRFALRTQDGRFLSVYPRLASMATSVVHPSPLQVLAVHRDEPGPEGEFVAVAAPAQGVDVSTGNSGFHRYAEEGVGFWNPLHKVFVRTNELGALDCSPECNATPLLGLLIPPGWLWERFTVHAVPECDGEGLRSRASIRAKAALAGA